MAVFLNTRGRAVLTVAICDRCARKFPIGELRSDPNAPGLKVCRADLDQLDPFRRAPRLPENITPRFVRKDVDISLDAQGQPVTPDPGGSTPPPTPGGSGDSDALLDVDGNPFTLDQGTLG